MAINSHFHNKNGSINRLIEKIPLRYTTTLRPAVFLLLRKLEAPHAAASFVDTGVGEQCLQILQSVEKGCKRGGNGK